MIKKNSENIDPILDLFPVSNNKVELSYSGEKISSDGGLLLLREMEKNIGLLDDVSSCISDGRDSRYIDHALKEMITQRVFQIAAGYEDCNDCNELRIYMVFRTCADLLPQSGAALASQPTMSRLENSVTTRYLYKIGRKLLDFFVASYTTRPGVIIINCDDTNNNTFGQQEPS